MLLRARYLLPISAPSVEDGAVLVSGDRIAAVGRWVDLRGQAGEALVVDLGDVVLMPGWINAHCHLDYTHFAGHLPPPRSFTDWIRGVLALKAGWSFSEYAASWLAGARQLLRCGCTTVLDIEAVPELLPEAWDSTPLRVISAFEMTGVRSERTAAELVDEVLVRAGKLVHPRNRVALSPHAPYSTRPALLELAAREARDRGWLLTTHVAESDEEYAMFRQAGGPMHQWIAPQRGGDDCGQRSPVAHLGRCGVLGPTTLAVHANYLDPGDARLLGASGCSVVHCPQSHDYFAHAPFPYHALRAAGVPVCLGTDSMISVRRLGRRNLELDLLAEFRQFRRMEPSVSALEVLRMATEVAARSIGRASDLGALHAGMLADLVAIPVSPGSRAGGEALAEAVLAHQGAVAASMIEGRWALAPGWTSAEGGVPA